MPHIMKGQLRYDKTGFLWGIRDKNGVKVNDGIQRLLRIRALFDPLLRFQPLQFINLHLDRLGPWIMKPNHFFDLNRKISLIRLV